MSVCVCVCVREREREREREAYSSAVVEVAVEGEAMEGHSSQKTPAVNHNTKCPLASYTCSEH